MKLSLNWAQEFSNVDLTKIGQEKLFEKIGSQLGAIDEVIEWGPRYKGMVVVKVVACEKHQNADKLSVCLIDDNKAVKKVSRNKDGFVELVCGAPNVRAGMLAVWIPPGVTVPETFDAELFVIEAREIRGVISNGMLASHKELGLSQQHTGILEIDQTDKVKPGEPFVNLYGLDDTIVDIENKMFTHRPDCFGVLGLARELAGIQHSGFKSPEWYLNADKFQIPNSKFQIPLEARNDAPELVPRFMAVAVDGVDVRPSPNWLQACLSRVGIRPINNIVDITNYVMYLTGQPLHAYDYDKLAALDGGKSATLIARPTKKGERVTLLDGKEREIAEGTIVIASKKAVVGIGGVMGAVNTEVDESTRRIVLECATFDMYSIRRSSMANGIFTDAVTRFSKGQSPWQNAKVINYALKNIAEIAGGKVASALHDLGGKLVENKPVKVTADFINERLGFKLKATEIKTLLENVEFKVELIGQTAAMRVLAPFWRTDIEIAEDIVEEVGRLYGYDKLPLELPQRNLKATSRDPKLEFKQQVREILGQAGANEVLSYSFVHGDLMKRAGQNPEHAYSIANAISPELQYYRTSLIPSLLDKVHPNVKAGFGEFAVFEIGKSHVRGLMDTREPQVPAEEERLALVYANKSDQVGAAYYEARRFADFLFDKLGLVVDFIPGAAHEPKSIEARECWAPFDKSRSAYMQTADGLSLGVVGEYKVSVRQGFKLPQRSAGIELNIENLRQAASELSRYQPLPEFPKVNQDITLKTSAEVSFAEILNFIKYELEKLLGGGKYRHSLETIDIYQSDKDKAHKNITFRLNVASYERTLTDKEVNDILEKVASSAKKHLKAERV